jgi:hypothetical protein
MEPLLNPVPRTVRLMAFDPAIAEEGSRLLMTGTELGVMVNVRAVEVPPSGSGVVTVTSAVPAVEI